MEIIDPQLRGSGSSTHAPNSFRLPQPLSHDGRQARSYYTPPHPLPPSQRPRLQSDVHHQYEPSPAVDTNEDPHKDPKRPRACEACRGLKVRCDLNATNPEGACRRCAKAGRQCVISYPSRKRQKKTDSRVAELEKRIDALTASLQATKSGEVGEQSGGGSPEVEDSLLRVRNEEPSPSPSDPAKPHSKWPPHDENVYTETTLRSPLMSSIKSTISSHTLAGQKRRRSDDREDREESVPARPQTAGVRGRSMNDYASAYPLDVPPHGATKRPPVAPVTSSTSQVAMPAHEYADVIDRKILEASEAGEMFDHYKRHMAPHFPAVVFPPETSAAKVRRTKSILFLAVLSVSSSGSLQQTLSKELMRRYADHIIVKGEKTLEIIQALQVSATWYAPPEHYEESKFYQLIHIAAVMALDLGLGKRTKQTRPKTLGLNPWRKTPLPDPNSLDCRRAWLGCYILCVNASMALRRSNLLRWNEYALESIRILETSPNAYASDSVLCQWAKIQHVTEEIGVQFCMDDDVAQGGVLDTKLQYTLKGFERQLEDWTLKVPTDLYSPILKLSEHVVNLYMHEVAIHTDDCTDNVNCNSNTETPVGLLAPAHISALSMCLTSIHGLFDTFLSCSTDTIRNLPVFHFVYVAYACVLLVRMCFAATTTNAELGRVISKEDLKVEYYFDVLLKAFKAAAENEMSRAAQKFLVVLMMLRTWFHKQSGCKTDMIKDANTSSRSLDDGMQEERAASRLGHQQIPLNRDSTGHPRTTMSSDLNTSSQLLHSASTPLHLLSEVAMGDSAANSTASRHMRTPTGQEWYDFINRGSTNSTNPATGPMAVGTSYTDSPPNGDGPATSVLDGGGKFDWNFSVVNEELEQAMGMTLGEWDLGSVLQADGFLFDLGFDGGPTGVFEGSG